jgi:hypothetical protein
MNTREQGDIGELSAMCWLASKGAKVALPIGHSPDYDLIADLRGRLIRVQVKTCTCRPRSRWVVSICTRGGNQSWNGLVKRLDASRCDYLFVLVGDGRRWFLPIETVCGGTALRLGGPKYAAFEVEPGEPIPTGTDLDADSRISAPSLRGDARVDKGSGL